MHGLKRARNFDGVSFILDSEEFDAIVCHLKDCIKIGEANNFSDSYLNVTKRLLNVLSTKSYFAEYEEEVHCMLGFSEFERLFESILLVIPSAKDDEINFEKCLADENTKKWVTRKED